MQVFHGTQNQSYELHLIVHYFSMQLYIIVFAGNFDMELQCGTLDLKCLAIIVSYLRPCHMVLKATRSILQMFFFSGTFILLESSP